MQMKSAATDPDSNIPKSVDAEYQFEYLVCAHFETMAFAGLVPVNVWLHLRVPKDNLSSIEHQIHF